MGEWDVLSIALAFLGFQLGRLAYLELTADRRPDVPVRLTAANAGPDPVHSLLELYQAMALAEENRRKLECALAQMRVEYERDALALKNLPPE